ncbi:MAG: HNH endonuclease, partial [Bacteroidota bacterium]
CEMCGESHPAALDFHHRDPSEKDTNLASVVGMGWSRDRIIREINKCDVICSNCHRKLHWNDGV